MERSVTADELRQRLEHPPTPLLLDVRRQQDVAADPVQIPQAQWRDPEEVRTWSTTLPKDTEIVIYCVRGRSVSNSVLDQLLERGLKARLLEGGIEAWKAQASATVGKQAGKA